MFAIIKTGGKQYKVAANDIIKVEKLVGESGDSIEFTDVLMMGEGNAVKIGTPFVTKAKVCGTVLDQIRDDKVIIFKKNRRHNYRRKNGHRQSLTVVQITELLPEGGTPKKETSSAKVPEKKVKAKATDSSEKAKPEGQKAPQTKGEGGCEKGGSKSQEIDRKIGD